jgi:hypothetical protein
METKRIKKSRSPLRIPLAALILASALYGCSSSPAEQTDSLAAPGSGSLTGTWKLTTADSSSQVLEFRADGTGSFNAYDALGQLTKSAEISYAFDDDTRFRRIGKEWVIFIPCEVNSGQLTLKTTGEVFTKQ